MGALGVGLIVVLIPIVGALGVGLIEGLVVGVLVLGFLEEDVGDSDGASLGSELTVNGTVNSMSRVLSAAVPVRNTLPTPFTTTVSERLEKKCRGTIVSTALLRSDAVIAVSESRAVSRLTII